MPGKPKASKAIVLNLRTDTLKLRMQFLWVRPDWRIFLTISIGKVVLLFTFTRYLTIGCNKVAIE